MTRGRMVLAGALGVTVGLGGCVERRLHITSDPPGAIVHLNDVEVGVTPLEVEFTWYGVYDVRLEKDGYDPLVTTAHATAPGWETPGADLFAELAPWGAKREIHWAFTLTSTTDDPDAAVARARAMRDLAFPVEPIEPGRPPT